MKKKASGANPRVVLAHKEGEKTITAAPFSAQNGTIVFSNIGDKIHSPFSETAESLSRLGSHEDTISEEEIASMHFLGTCQNEDCACNLLTTPEMAEQLGEGDTLNCVSCGTAHEIGANPNELIAVVDDTDDEQEDDEGDEDDAEEEQQQDDDSSDDDSEDEQEDDDEDSGDEEDDDEGKEESSAIDVIDDEDAEDVISKEELSELISLAREMASNDESIPEDEIDTIVANIEKAAKAPAKKTKEVAAVADQDDDAEEVASVDTETFVVDLSAEVDFNPESIRLVPVDSGCIACFVTDAASGNLTNLGFMHARKASSDNQKFFKDTSSANLKTLSTAFIAAAEQASDLEGFGFEPVIRTLSLPTFFANKAKEQASVEVASSMRNSEHVIGEYDQALATAAVAMNKGLWDNPLIESLTAHLNKSGMTSGAERTAAKVVAEAANIYVAELKKKALELMQKTPEAREEVAQFVSSARQSGFVSAGLEEPSNFIVSTAGLDATSFETESPAPVTGGGSKVVSAAKRLFK